MDSIEPKSKIMQIKEELLEDKIGSNSLNTYITPNNLWSFHHMKQNMNSDLNDSNDNSHARGSASGQMASIVNPSKSGSQETRIQIESEANFTFIAEPTGPFSNNEIRNGFIRKVYGILSVQLFVTIIGTSIMLFCFREDLNFKELDKNNNKAGKATALILLIAGFMIVLCVVCALSYVEYLRRTVPINFILLGLFTAAETVVVGIICCQYYGKHILLAFIITGVVVMAITLLAMTPWFDITNCGLLLCILGVIHLIMGLVIYGVMFAISASVEDMKPWLIIISVLGAFLFSLYLLYDTQLILGGKSMELTPEEYILGAVRLYVDIIQIFLYILQILGFVDRN